MAEGVAVTGQANANRKKQLRQWSHSCTNQEAAEPRWQGRRTRVDNRGDDNSGRTVRFERAAEFLAACAGGDLLEAEEMLRGEDGKKIIDSTNTDGISALHQACIDENLELVKFLINHCANVNQADNEGWTPLHVAASCGYMEIAEYLLKHSANISAVNSDGEVPLDLAEDDCMEVLLCAEIEKKGIDIDLAKREEEKVMLQDARQWLNAGKIEDVQHPKTGASALHVAAAKGYIEVMRLLLQTNFDPNVQDKDGWTPLHAAAHWGVEEACRLLVENLCDMNVLNNVGQRPCDVADEEIASLLEELQKKQKDLRSEKEASLKRTIIDTCTEQPQVNTSKHKRSSVCRMSSKEKIFIQDQSKEMKTLDTLTVGDEDGSSNSEEETELTSNGKVFIQASGLLPEPKNITWGSISNSKKDRKLCSLAGRRNFNPQDSCSPNSEEDTECGLHMNLDMVPTIQLHINNLTSKILTNSTSTFSTSASVNPRDRQRSYQAPVRDEESESQRKARSRHMRQSRRSTQGVTLTDLKKAEKTQGKSTDSAELANLKCGDTGEQVQKEQLQENQMVDTEKQEALQCIQTSGNRVTDSLNRYPPYQDIPEKDHTKLYEDLRLENEILEEQLQEMEFKLTQLRLGLERVTQIQERNSERPALLELERFERRALERKAAELEEELKVLSDLKADNQRLKDENTALIRVISRLSK